MYHCSMKSQLKGVQMNITKIKAKMNPGAQTDNMLFRTNIVCLR